MRKKVNGVWGDDIEIQALSEIYNRPIEIYAYSNVPMRTFHEQDEGAEPFRLSYHGKSHYNSVISHDWCFDNIYIKSKPGKMEDEAIQLSKFRIDEGSIQSDKKEPFVLERTEENIKLLRQIIQRSREEF